MSFMLQDSLVRAMPFELFKMLSKIMNSLCNGVQRLMEKLVSLLLS